MMKKPALRASFFSPIYYEITVDISKRCIARTGMLSNEDIKSLKNLSDLYKQAKYICIFAEETDPTFSANVQVIKELRDALDHIMRVIAKRLDQTDTHLAPPADEAAVNEYARINLDKAYGHLFRATFDAVEGCMLSLREKVIKELQSYRPQDLLAALPDYAKFRSQLNELANKLTDFRQRKDVGNGMSDLLEEYVREIKQLYDSFNTITAHMDLLKGVIETRKKDARNGLWINVALTVGGVVLGYALGKM